MQGVRKQRNYWNKENVFNESHKYTSRSEFRKGSYQAYWVALKNGWLNDMGWLLPKKKNDGFWKIKENVILESKKYKSISLFKKECNGGWASAIKNNWINEIREYYNQFIEDNSNKYCIYAYLDECNRVAYIGLTSNKEQRHNTHLSGGFKGYISHSSVYDYYLNKDVEIPTPIYLEEKLTPKQAREREQYWYDYYKNFLKYKMLNRKKCGDLGGMIQKWTKESVFEVSKLCKSRTELSKKYNGAYKVARTNGWLNELFPTKKSKN